MNPTPPCLTLALAGLLCACNETSDGCVGLAEDGLLVSAYITDDGKKAQAELEVRRPDDDTGLALGLCEGSALYVDGARATRVRRPSGASVYKVTVDGIEGAKVEHTLLLRDDDFRDEYVVTVEAPAFEITSPKAGVELSRAGTWDLAWTPARPGATIRARVDDVVDGESCLGAPFELDLPDEGAAQISPGALKVDPVSVPTVAKCEATIRLSRIADVPLERAGEAASRLHADSRVLAATARELSFLSVP